MQKDKLQQALAKGQQFFSKENYQLAKHHFDIALKLDKTLIEDPILSKKIEKCRQQEPLLLRKEVIKKGRRSEKKKKYSMALEYFIEANKLQKEEWLEKKILELKGETAQSQLSDLETENDPKTELKICQQALQLDQNNITIKKRLAQCQVKLQQYNKAIKLFSDINDLSDADYYYLGYAYLQTGELLQGLVLWLKISPQNKQSSLILAQLETLLPYAIQKLETLSYQAENTKILKDLYESICQNASLIESKQAIEIYYIKHLWQAAEYTSILKIITPLPVVISITQLDFYAKLFFKLATIDVQYLEQAISFWLSAIYNETLLNRLSTADDIELAIITSKLEDLLTELIKSVEKEHLLPEQLKKLFENERYFIQLLAKLPNKEIATPFFPCTPIFAQQSKITDQIYQLIQSNKALLIGEEKDQISEIQFNDLCLYFSPLAEPMLMADNKKERDAFKYISQKVKFNNPILSNYCRQKIAYQYAFRMLIENTDNNFKNIEKYFLMARPLIEKHPQYADKLTQLSLLSETPIEIYNSLATVMEPLNKKIKTAKFIEATSYAMALKAKCLMEQNVKMEIIDKLLQRALKIAPDSLIVKSMINKKNEFIIFQQINKAFKVQNPIKAAKVIIQAEGDKSEYIEYFFETIESWRESVLLWNDQEDKKLTLYDFYKSCRRLDKHHPLTIQMGKDIEQL